MKKKLIFGIGIVIIVVILGVGLMKHREKMEAITKGIWVMQNLVNSQGEIEFNGDKTNTTQITNRNISLTFIENKRFEIKNNQNEILWKGKYKLQKTTGDSVAIIFTLDDNTQEIGTYGKVVFKDGTKKETIVMNMQGYGISFKKAGK